MFELDLLRTEAKNISLVYHSTIKMTVWRNLGNRNCTLTRIPKICTFSSKDLISMILDLDSVAKMAVCFFLKMLG